MSGTTEAFARVKIDALLKDADWNLTDGSSVLFEHVLPDGTQADYVLCDRQGRPMAALEAKRASTDPITAQDQGRHYAEQLGVPFVFLSNGEEVRFLDREIIDRDYQIECIEALSAEVLRGRRKLVENNTVEAVLSLPGGVFNPYSGVKTSVLVFRKGGATGRVMFLHAENDGFKLDANHDQLIDEDDLPDLIEASGDRDTRWAAWGDRDPVADWTENWWFAEADAIRAADFNLSANRHRPQNRARVEHRDPLEILHELRDIETEILGEIDELAEAVRGAVAE